MDLNIKVTTGRVISMDMEKCTGLMVALIKDNERRQIQVANSDIWFDVENNNLDFIHQKVKIHY